MGFDSDVINMYLHVYLPRAIWLAKWTRMLHAGGGGGGMAAAPAQQQQQQQRYVYTTHAYLISLFLDCPPHMGIKVRAGWGGCVFARARARRLALTHTLTTQPPRKKKKT